MKKSLWVTLVAVAATVTSCTKKDYYTTPSTTIIAPVTAANWTVDQAGTAWIISINMPEITDAVALNDLVTVAISYNYNASSASSVQFEAIPELYQGYSYSFVYQTGQLFVYAQTPTGTLPTNSPGALWVKIVLTPSNPG